MLGDVVRRDGSVGPEIRSPMTPDPESVAVERAEHLIDLDRPGEAAALLAVAIAEHPESPRLHLCLSRALLALGDAGALAAAERALALTPADDWGHRLRALALSAQRRHAEALSAADEAVRVAPLQWLNHLTVAECSSAAGRAKAGLDAARRAVSSAPEQPDAHLVLGIVAGRAGRRREARAAYRRTLALDPANARALNDLTRLEEGLRPLTSTRGYLSALSLDPQSRQVRKNLDRSLGDIAFWVLAPPGLLAYGASRLSVDWWWSVALALAWWVGAALVLRRQSATLRRLVVDALRLNLEILLLTVVWLAVFVAVVTTAQASGRFSQAQETVIILSTVALLFPGLWWVGRRARRRG